MSKNKSKKRSLQEYLDNDNIKGLENALKLEHTIGFPYSEYKYSRYDWNSEKEYNDFIAICEKNNSISSQIHNKYKRKTYYITIILYKNQYFTQIEWILDRDNNKNIWYTNNPFTNYLSALKFTYQQVFH